MSAGLLLITRPQIDMHPIPPRGCFTCHNNRKRRWVANASLATHLFYSIVRLSTGLTALHLMCYLLADLLICCGVLDAHSQERRFA